ncbi:hypothetical protein E2C01_044863 [Portunus trituberculatus]|uniref:Reverse transcriptase zinc-binding domain-containing protein n=1 Tax=Portunus trituberculatus TaxID=210409 RepID=A0A5B7FZH1_PORTR|nr:hypothetical protein [Portunus trituberculatus]
MWPLLNPYEPWGSPVWVSQAWQLAGLPQESTNGALVAGSKGVRDGEGPSAGEDERRYKIQTFSQSQKGAQGTPGIALLRLGHTTLKSHLHHLRLSCDPFCPRCRTTPESMEHILLQCPRLLSQHSALRSRLSALAITTLNLLTLLAASGVHLSWQPAVLRLTCAFLRKPASYHACGTHTGLPPGLIRIHRFFWPLLGPYEPWGSPV